MIFSHVLYHLSYPATNEQHASGNPGPFQLSYNEANRRAPAARAAEQEGPFGAFLFCSIVRAANHRPDRNV